MDIKGLDGLKCSFCNVVGAEGNPWRASSESDGDGLIYSALGCKDHHHLVDACVAAQALQPKREQSNRYVPEPGSIRVRGGGCPGHGRTKCLLCAWPTYESAMRSIGRR